MSMTRMSDKSYRKLVINYNIFHIRLQLISVQARLFQMFFFKCCESSLHKYVYQVKEKQIQSNHHRGMILETLKTAQ